MALSNEDNFLKKDKKNLKFYKCPLSLYCLLWKEIKNLKN